MDLWILKVADSWARVQGYLSTLPIPVHKSLFSTYSISTSLSSRKSISNLAPGNCWAWEEGIILFRAQRRTNFDLQLNIVAISQS